MIKTKNTTPELQSQKSKFIAAAKAHGCEDDEAAFKAKLRRLVPAKAAPKSKKTPS